MAAGSVALRRGLTKVKKPKYMGMAEEVKPLRLPAPTAKKKGSSAAALATTAAVGTAAMADGKKESTASKAKGRRGGIVDPVFPPLIRDSETKKAETKAAKKEEPKKEDSKKAAGREVKNGKVFVSAEELKKSGLSLRDFLNKERGLTRREDKPKLKPLKTMAEDRKALDEKAAKKKAREEEVKKMVAAAGLAKGGMAKRK